MPNGMLTQASASSGDWVTYRDEASSRSVARAVIGDTKVIVDSLGDVEALHLVALLSSGFVDYMCGLSGVVAANVEEELNVKFLQHWDHFGKVLFGWLHAHRSKSSSRDLRHRSEVFRCLLPEVNQVLGQEALDAVPHAQYAGDVVVLKRLRHEAHQRLVNHNRRPPRLPDHSRPRQAASLLCLLLLCRRHRQSVLASDPGRERERERETERDGAGSTARRRAVRRRELGRSNLRL